MNPIFQAAGETARLGWLMGILTVLFLICFVGWTWWTYSSRNKALMERMSRMPIGDGGDE